MRHEALPPGWDALYGTLIWCLPRVLGMLTRELG